MKEVDYKAKKENLIAMLCGIRSLHNVGSMFRTADGVGIGRLYLCGETPYPPRDAIAKTALGAEEAVPWEYWLDPVECAEALASGGVRLIAIETGPRSVDFRGFKSDGRPLCLVVGNEVDGIPRAVLDRCDSVLRIPMRGKKGSLNVSVAFGVAAYELTRNLREM